MAVVCSGTSYGEWGVSSIFQMKWDNFHYFDLRWSKVLVALILVGHHICLLRSLWHRISTTLYILVLYPAICCNPGYHPSFLCKNLIKVQISINPVCCLAGGNQVHSIKNLSTGWTISPLLPMQLNILISW